MSLGGRLRVHCQSELTPSLTSSARREDHPVWTPATVLSRADAAAPGPGSSLIRSDGRAIWRRPVRHGWPGDPG